MFLGGKCSHCDFNDSRALQIDHVNGNGADDRREFGEAMYTKNFLKRVLASPGKYQVLCANCNWIKRAEQGESRKKRSA